MTVKQSFAIESNGLIYQSTVNSVARYGAYEENANVDSKVFGLVTSNTIFEIAGSLA